MSQDKALNNILSVNNLIAGYGRKIVLDGLTFEAIPGKILTLIGPNGSGKSTVLKTITSQLSKLGGRIVIENMDIERLSEKEIAKKMSIVMTENVRVELMTCREMIATGRYPYTGMLGILSEEDKRIVDEAIEIVNVGNIIDEDFGNISDGQRQRVMLARAICQEPDILILDEPTSFLDIKYKLEILGLIKKLARDKNIAVVMSLHELDFARYISDYIVAINDGKIYEAGKPNEVFCKGKIQKLYGIKPEYFDCENASIRFDNYLADINKGFGAKDKRTKSPKVIMIQGTMSNAGKSLITAGLCRVFTKDGYRVAPFKSQNMALNSYITDDGLEMGRAQVMQAECCNRKPDVCMNPILLKPTDDMGSQVIVNGKVIGNMRAREYFQYKKKLIPDILKAFEELSKTSDIIVVEGAGSPAEINLKENDIVNMGLAKMLDADVLLVGDIDRGGVFAQLLGTIELLTLEERARIKGLVINKFRGDKSILDSGIDMLEERSGIKVSGVVPYMNIKVEDEDSLTERFYNKEVKEFDIAVIKYPHISNFTDFDVFEQLTNVSVRYVTSVMELGSPDIIMLPGSKNTIGDLNFIYENGFDKELIKAAKENKVIIGICGGYQMLGLEISDPYNVESGGNVKGLGLLNVETILKKDKHTSQYEGDFCIGEGIFKVLKGVSILGYEIHMGETRPVDDMPKEFTSGQTGYYSGNVYGSYVHGLFDKRDAAKELIKAVANKNGKNINVEGVFDYASYKETQYDILEKTIREYMDMDYIYKILGIER